MDCANVGWWETLSANPAGDGLFGFEVNSSSSVDYTLIH